MKPKNESVLPKPKTNWLFLLLVAAVAFFAYSYVVQAAVIDTASVEVETKRVADPGISRLSYTLLTQSQTLRSMTDSTEKNKKIAELRTVADKRRAALIRLQTTDPKKFADSVLSVRDIKKLPADVADLVEKVISVSGVVRITVADDFEHHTAQESASLLSADGNSHPLYSMSATGNRSLKTGMEIVGDVVAFGQSYIIDPAVLTVPIIQPNVSLGIHKVAVVMFNFQNRQLEPMTADAVRSVVWAQDGVKDYYQEVSGTQTIIGSKVHPEGDVYGWVTIPYTYDGDCTDVAWGQAAEQILTDQGVDLSGYDNIIYYFPYATQCHYGGLAELGGGRVWINNYFNIPAVAHEIGHNLGALHANTYVCFDSQGHRATIGTICNSNSYGDPFDIMGLNNVRHMSAYHKAQVGWYQRPSDTQVISATGYYEMIPVESFALGVKSLIIPIDQFTSYYLEYRQPTRRFDNFAPSDPAVNGVSIRIARSDGEIAETNLLDTTPSTNTFNDAPLVLGNTFVDPRLGFSITVRAITPDLARVEFSNVCSHNKPLVAIEPSQLSTRPEISTPYHVTINNMDSPACSASNFTLGQAIVPSQWSFQLATTSTSTVTILAGQAATIDGVLTPNPQAMDDDYLLYFPVTDSVGPAYSVQTGSVVTIDTIAPYIWFTSDSIKDNATLGINASIMLSTGSYDGYNMINSGVILLDNRLVKDCGPADQVLSCDYSMTARQAGVGKHVLRIEVVDMAGNTNYKDFHFTVTRTVPIVEPPHIQ